MNIHAFVFVVACNCLLLLVSQVAFADKASETKPSFSKHGHGFWSDPQQLYIAQAKHNHHGLLGRVPLAIGLLTQRVVTEAELEAAVTLFISLQENLKGVKLAYPYGSLTDEQMRNLDAFYTLQDVCIMICCAYAHIEDPVIRGQMSTFLEKGIKNGSHREYCMGIVLEYGFLSQANRMLAEQLFEAIPFSIDAYTIQIEALAYGLFDKRLAEELHGVPLRKHLQEYLLGNCLDADAKQIADTLVEQGVATQQQRTMMDEYHPKMPDIWESGDDAFYQNYFGVSRPTSNWIRYHRLQQQKTK